MTRQQRFAAANLQPAGLALSDEMRSIPGKGGLLRLGLRYSCLKSPGSACRAETWSRRADEAPWISFSTLSLPPRDRFQERVGEHYQSGCPLFLRATTERIDLEARYKAMASVQGETLENLKEGVAAFGTDGRLRLYNPAFARIW